MSAAQPAEARTAGLSAEHAPANAWQLAPGELAELVRLRRAIHAQPELAFQEHRTAALVAAHLRALGLEPACGVAGTGVVAVLDTGRPGRTVAVRADLDALPMPETTNLPFRSQVPGVAHTCGHDVHCAIGLGAAVLLTAQRARLSGRFKFVFQPAEETLQGALAMIEAGVLREPAVDVMLGFHNSPQLAAGRIAFRHGASMASSNALRITVHGSAGHAAHPTSGIDALQAVPLVLGSLDAIRTREVAPDQPLVLAIGKIAGGRARNVICDQVVLEGTCRTLDDGLTAQVRQALERRLQGIAAATRTRIELDWQALAPALLNDAATLDAAVEAAGQALGREAVVALGAPSMGSEDFAWYGRHVPLAHLRIGSGSEDTTAAAPTNQLHQTGYLCDERAIGIGATALAAAAARLAT